MISMKIRKYSARRWKRCVESVYRTIDYHCYTCFTPFHARHRCQGSFSRGRGRHVQRFTRCSVLQQVTTQRFGETCRRKKSRENVCPRTFHLERQISRKVTCLSSTRRLWPSASMNLRPLFSRENERVDSNTMFQEIRQTNCYTNLNIGQKITSKNCARFVLDFLRN